MIRAEYWAVPIGMTEGSVTQITDPKPFVNMSDFRSGRNVPKYATLEQDYWWLDGSYENFPDEPENIGYMSAIQSEQDNSISVTLTREYDNQYASVGIGFDFDTNADEYPTSMTVEWYQNDTLLDSENVIPDSSTYFVSKNVTGFNKIVVTFNSMKSPNHYLKIFNIYDGIVRKFNDNEIGEANLIEEIYSDNEALPSNELEVTLIKPEDLALMFQRTLPFKIYRNNEMYGNFFIENSQSDYKKTKFTVIANDYMNVLETQTFLGGFYTNKPLNELIAELLGTIPFELSSELSELTISGYMPAQSKRESLRQISFAINGMVDTSHSDKIIIKSLSNIVSSTIDESRIVSFNKIEEKPVTTINVNSTSYAENSNSTELYNDNLNGTLTLIFDEPHSNYSISGGTIIQSGANFVIIQSNNRLVTLNGLDYDSKTIQESKFNTNFVTTDMPNVKSYDRELYSEVDILNELKFLKYRITCTFKLENERVGDLVYINNDIARIISLNYNLINGNIYADAEMEVYDEQTE